MLADLPRNGFGRAPTRINDVLRHFACLRPSLLGCFTRVAKHFVRVTGGRRSSRGSIRNDFLGVPGRCGGGRRGALYPLADCLPGLCHARRYAFWIVR